MKGLLVKEFLGMKNFFIIFLFVVAICMIPAFVSQDSDFSTGFMIAICIFIGGMMGFTSFAYDKAYGWDSYVLSLPYTRKQLVLSKYLFSLLITGIGAAIGFTVNLILVALGVAQMEPDAWMIVGILACMVGIFISIMIPLMYWFGIEKARIIVIVIFLVPFMLLSIIGGKNGAEGMMETIAMLMEFLPFVSVAALVVSWFVSVRIYTKKEV